MRPPFLAVVCTLALAAAAPAQHIAPTDPKSPADERASFTVPPGFEVQLVAAEPDIQKPIQMAFDAKGRLWVTTSHRYPFPAAVGEGTDRLYILSDFGPDGRAKKVEVFADNLNIPIGILPLPDCKSCLVSSAGVVYKLTDTKGTGKADKREVILSGFGYADTHGMVNSFTLMPDGWVYACHGFRNESTIRAENAPANVPVVKIQSGNTIRFRPDGSDVQVFTRGQVNPFGMAVDPWFNLYTADCHSKPITQLIPGAVYPSFGKPHDGLGFGPDMIGHDHGSTALCGLTYYDADHFPAKYRNTMFLGNVVTNRINFDHIEWQGSSPKAVHNPDFLVSKDPWFRPADIKLGPDGALYVTDFYNKIIGHYEVDLKHPQRDKDRGRVWRIVWKGEPGVTAPKAPLTMPFTDLTSEPANVLAQHLASPNIAVRLLATQECIRRKDKAADLGAAVMKVALEQPRARPYLPLILERWGAFTTPEQLLLTGYVAIQGTKGKAGDIAMPENLFRPLLGREKLDDGFRNLVNEFLTNTAGMEAKLFNWPPSATPNNQSARVLVELAARFPDAANVKPLIELLKKVPAEDTHLRHAARIALRNSLQVTPEPFQDLSKVKPEDGVILADVAFGIPTHDGAVLLSRLLTANWVPADRVAAAAEHIGRYTPWTDAYRPVIARIREAKGNEQRAAVQAFVRGLQAGGHRVDIVTADVLVAAAVAGVDAPTPAARVAALKTVGDLPSVLDKTFKLSADGPLAAVTGLMTDAKQPEEVRAAVFDTLVKLDPKASLGVATEVIDSPKSPPALLERVAVFLAASKDRNHKLAAKDALKSVPYRSAVVVATALADSAGGADVLLDAVRKGIAPARILQEKQVAERLRAARLPNVERDIADLTRGLQPPDQKVAELIKRRTKSVAAAKPDRELGAKLFTTHCGACHQVGGMGGKVGPNLDGIGVRGLERLLEDTLDPNRNVDAAFRARVLTLADGRSVTGLMQRVEGEVLVFADTEGKETRIPLKDIEKNRETTLSPMPANFGETIPEADFQHLMGYLLGLREKKEN